MTHRLCHLPFKSPRTEQNPTRPTYVSDQRLINPSMATDFSRFSSVTTFISVHDSRKKTNSHKNPRLSCRDKGTKIWDPPGLFSSTHFFSSSSTSLFLEKPANAAQTWRFDDRRLGKLQLEPDPRICPGPKHKLTMTDLGPKLQLTHTGFKCHLTSRLAHSISDHFLTVTKKGPKRVVFHYFFFTSLDGQFKSLRLYPGLNAYDRHDHEIKVMSRILLHRSFLIF